MDFYQSLNYSLGNEDWTVEKKALRVQQGDNVICVTASGDRALHLLLTDCAEVISFDMNPSQTHLLALKVAACAQLDYEHYLAFLGCLPCSNRYATFKKLKSMLTPPAQQYWESHRNMLCKGIILQGKTERLLQLSSSLIRLFRNEKVKKLFSFTNIEDQRQFVNSEWETVAWRKAFEFSIRLFVRPKIFKYILNDPGLHAYTEYADYPAKYIYDRIHLYLQRHLANTSPLLQFLFTGQLAWDLFFPYLTFEGHQKIRKRLSHLKFYTGNIIDYLSQQNAKQFDCYSLSDIASYMPQTAFEKLLINMKATAKKDARFCLREFMSKRSIPHFLIPHFQRDNVLEKQLEEQESNCIYRLMVGTIKN